MAVKVAKVLVLGMLFFPVTLSLAESSSAPEPVNQTEPAKKKGFFKALFSRKKATPPQEESRPSQLSQPLKEAALEAASEKKAPESSGSKIAETRDVPSPSAEPMAIPSFNERLNQFVVVADETEFYSDGPLQDQEPDFLKRGTIVTVIKPRRGWTDVRNAAGEIGTVATDLIRKAKASDFPVVELVLPEPNGDSGVASVGNDDLPMVVVPPPPLPEIPLDDTSMASPSLLLPPLPE